MRSRKRIFLGLGSNVGNRLGYIVKALHELGQVVGVRRVSTLYESEPWGVREQGNFLNCCAECITDLEPVNLLKTVKEIEKSVGRKERYRWGPREIDIDILLYGEEIISLPELTIPHPYIDKRDFVLIPLLEIDEGLEDPRTKTPFRRKLGSLEVSIKPFCCLL